MLHERLRRSLRVTFLGMAVNLCLAAGKMVAGVLGHSHALVADAVESFSDLFSSVVVWRGMVVASEPADEDHPYGHGKAEPIAAAVVASMLLAAAAGIAIQSVREIISPHQSPAAFTLWVLLAVIVIKETLFRFAHRESDALKSSAMRSDAWHHRSDAITSLFAGLGITVALIGGPGYAVADDVAAAGAALIIAWNGWRLLRPALDELMDASPDPQLVERLRQIARTVPGVEDVEKCYIRKMGYHLYVDMHVEVAPDMAVKVAHDIAHEVQNKIQREEPATANVLVHLEPAGQRRRPPVPPR